MKIQAQLDCHADRFPILEIDKDTSNVESHLFCCYLASTQTSTHNESDKSIRQMPYSQTLIKKITGPTVANHLTFRHTLGSLGNVSCFAGSSRIRDIITRVPSPSYTLQNNTASIATWTKISKVALRLKTKFPGNRRLLHDPFQ